MKFNNVSTCIATLMVQTMPRGSAVARCSIVEPSRRSRGRHTIAAARIDRNVSRARTVPRGDLPGWRLWLALVAVVGSFAASNFIVQRSSSAVATLAASMLDVAAPSIERMAAARRSVLQAEVLLLELAEQPTKR